MSKDRFSDSTPDIRGEACAWIAQLETGNLKPADMDAFREWINRSPRHASEIRRLARLSLDLNKLTDMAEPLREAVQHYRGIRAPSSSPWLPSKRWVAAFGSAFLVLLALILMISSRDPSENREPIYLATEVGDRLEHILPDGSTVELNTNSQIEVDYTNENRTVRLLQGEVLFTVEANPERPFLVAAGGKSIEAVGTAFLVRHDEFSFEIAVTHGKVKLEDLGPVIETDDIESTDTEAPRPEVTNADLATDSIMLQAGQSFSQSPDSDADANVTPTIELIDSDELRRKLAWRDGLLEFSDTPLEIVVREISRYSKLKVGVSDPALRDLKFGGMFRTGDTEPLFKALESAFEIEVVYLKPDVVELISAERG